MTVAGDFGDSGEVGGDGFLLADVQELVFTVEGFTAMDGGRNGLSVGTDIYTVTIDTAVGLYGAALVGE